MLKVGELAERAGLTVRTLHHYDSIGLLRPSARSDAGYRLYDRDDVARLQQIQALRRFGMALADIGAYLDSPDASPLAVIERQLASLDRQIGEATRMREQLLRVRAQLARGEAPELSTWLTTLEQMTMYDKYFSQAELQQLRLVQAKDAKMDWQALVSQVRTLMEQGVTPDSAEARQVARRWLEILDRDTGGNQDFASKLDQMLTNEPKARQETGISIELRAYMIAAIGELRLEVYGKYLPPEVIAQMRRHHASRGGEWPALFGRIREQMAADPSARAPASKELARQKAELFFDMVGTDPATVPLFRKAIASEPLLRMGVGMTDQMVAWLQAADAAP
ncbi:MerR family transcriptional regulator [Massilia solisilvae]|uniref:MerR family transcriptional regulator n=1 Tax=Massilia solisilvae TaxID=1811225 RepID=A0ABT2BP48_9BURK|nr:MerR family transcriptional regulator [Massilia solisilvae]MCS0610252.1 MerR family transcriptional regulator [Massilia solisilvae]